MYVEVPAHVRHESRQENAVQVRGGTNWDLSRSAVETPVAPVGAPRFGQGVDCPCDSPDAAAAAYRPDDRMPKQAPGMTVVFERGSATLTAEAQKALLTVPRKSIVMVAGHADVAEGQPRTLSQRRADSVAAFLKSKGHRVEAARSFANTRYLTTSPIYAEYNQRTDVWIRP